VTRTPPEYFERLYQAHDDPWGFASRWYEQRKYDLTVASLPSERYRSGFEPGCSIGALTERLASRCDRLLAVDHVKATVAVAARRLAPYPQVRVEQRTVPDDWPEGPYDLLVLSEVCYYFDVDELRKLVGRAQRSLQTNATIVAVHWTGQTDYPLTAARTHQVLGATSTFKMVAHHVDEQFLLDVWRHDP
jgi:trans-aconitate methyltransferase